MPPVRAAGLESDMANALSFAEVTIPLPVRIPVGKS
jgi:hypothetical protein